MKFFVVFVVLFAASSSSPTPSVYVAPGEVNFDTQDKFLDEFKAVSRLSDTQKIATGAPGKKGEYPELCYFTVTFYQKIQRCGCFIVNDKYVATAARCVKDCSEGAASNITVTLLSGTGATAVQTVEKIIIPDGDNGMMYLAAYAEDGVPDFRTITGSNVAVLKLSKALTLAAWPAGPISKAKMTAEADEAAWELAHKSSEGWKLRACGIGVINNQGVYSLPGVVCTDLNKQVATECKNLPSDEAAVTVPAGDVCIQWPDRDNNVCVADYGGPVYAYKTDATGKFDTKTQQEVVCILVGSPNVRSNAQCLDGHINFCQWLPGPAAMMNAQSWITAVAV